jgi:hypothetical protein
MEAHHEALRFKITVWFEKRTHHEALSLPWGSEATLKLWGLPKGSGEAHIVALENHSGLWSHKTSKSHIAGMKLTFWNLGQKKVTPES